MSFLFAYQFEVDPLVGQSPRQCLNAIRELVVGWVQDQFRRAHSAPLRLPFNGNLVTPAPGQSMWGDQQDCGTHCLVTLDWEFPDGAYTDRAAKFTISHIGIATANLRPDSILPTWLFSARLACDSHAVQVALVAKAGSESGALKRIDSEINKSNPLSTVTRLLLKPILRGWHCQVGKTHLSSEPLRVGSKANENSIGLDPIRELVKVLVSPSRLIPYVVLANMSKLLDEVPTQFGYTRYAKSDRHNLPIQYDFDDYFEYTRCVKAEKRDNALERGLDFASYLQHHLVGLARVVELDTSEIDRLNQLISPVLACPPAGFRHYWPDLSTVSQPNEHSVFTATSVRKRTERKPIEESLRDELCLISASNFREGKVIRGARIAIAATRAAVVTARVAHAQEQATLADRLATTQSDLQQVRQSREELRRERDLLWQQVQATRRESAEPLPEAGTPPPTLSAAGYDEFTAELERTWDENARLRTELDALRSCLAETEHNLRAARENLAHAWQSPEVPADPATAPLAERTFAGVADALAAAAAEFNDILNMWDDAVRSAEESRFASPAQVFRALRAVAEVGRDYFAAREGGPPLGPIELAFEKRVPFKYSGFESQTTLSMFGAERVFRHNGRSRQMQRHLTLGGGDTANCLQIYFEFDDSACRVLVGYCGRHLPYFGRRT